MVDTQLWKLRDTSGARVLYFTETVRYFMRSTDVVDAQFYKLYGRPFARVLHVFEARVPHFVFFDKQIRILDVL